MTTTINNEHKKLNVPNKREQNQTCLDSAEREGLRPKGNVPNLRFPEFQGEWEKKRLEECVEFLDGLRKPIKSEDRKSEQGLYPYYGASGIIDYIDGYIFDGEYILLSEDGANIIDRNYRVAFIAKGKIWVNNHAHVLQPYDGFDINFLSETLERLNYAVYNTGTTMPKLNQEVCRNINLKIPTTKEQNKIGNLLSLLNERISTQNKIIDKLQSLIKGIADNILDNPLWKKTYLRSFMQFFSTNSLSWEQLSYEEGEIRNLHYGLIHGFFTSGIKSYSLPMVKYGEMPKQYTLCQVGDVAFADASEDTDEIGKSVEFVDSIKGDTICGLHTIHGRDIKNRTVVGFKGFAFNSRYFHNQIKRLAQGTKIFSITANNLSSCYVYLPDFDTQKAIVKLLKAYEEKLLVSKRLLEQYEKQKQYLVRQMFI